MSLYDVKGQERVCQSLLRALTNRRLHHAYLFSGPDGVGKTLAAWNLAQAMLCSEPTDIGDTCDTCNVCQRVQAGQHADVHVVQRKTQSDGRMERYIKIDQIRELQQSLSFKAFEGYRRVVIVRDADKMTASTANAMLKTLEEPGDSTHFILVSDAAHRLLPTIISRCQRVNFAPLSTPIVAEHLARELEVSPEQINVIARLAQGSIGRGLAMADQDVFAMRTHLLSMLTGERPVQVYQLLEFADDLARPDGRDALEMNFHILRTWYRDMMVVLSDAPHDLLVHIDQRTLLEAHAQRSSAKGIAVHMQSINDAQTAIFERMANARLVLEALFVQLVTATS